MMETMPCLHEAFNLLVEYSQEFRAGKGRQRLAYNPTLTEIEAKLGFKWV